MGYAILHASESNTETPFFTPTGPLFTWFCQNGLPFAVLPRGAMAGHIPVL